MWLVYRIPAPCKYPSSGPLKHHPTRKPCPDISFEVGRFEEEGSVLTLFAQSPHCPCPTKISMWGCVWAAFGRSQHHTYQVLFDICIGEAKLVRYG